MNFDDFQKNLENAVEKTIEELGETMQEAAMSQKAMLRNRVQNKGFGANYKPGRYRKMREAKGYEVRFVNLTLTGDMFRGWIKPNNYRKGYKVFGTVAGDNLGTKNKLKWNHSRYPTFVQANQEEKTIITNFVKGRVTEILKRNLNL